MTPRMKSNRLAVIVRNGLTQLVWSVATAVVATMVISHVGLAPGPALPAKSFMRAPLAENARTGEAHVAAVQEQVALARFGPDLPRAHAAIAPASFPERARLMKKAVSQTAPIPAPRPKDNATEPLAILSEPAEAAPNAPRSIRARLAEVPELVWTEVSKVPRALNDATSQVPLISALVARLPSTD